MQLHKYFFLTIFLVLYACSHPPVQTPAPPTQSNNRSAKLPPTWTHTPTVNPTQTPVRTPTRTFTPFPSVTPLPATLTSSPTSDGPSLSATPTITPTLDTSCTINALEEGIPIHLAPFIDPYRVLPTLSPETIYQATSIYPPYFEIELDDKLIGWVDSQQRSLEIQGAGCNLLPADTRALAEFPSLCFFTSQGEAITYSDRVLTEPYLTITNTESYVLLLKYSDVYYTSAGESGPGFFIRADQVSTYGSCERVPFAGLTVKDTWLWSQPNVEKGQQLEKLRPAQRLFVQEGPIQGGKLPSDSPDGGWYYVLANPHNDGKSGWVWSSDVFIE
jgi:hypothetical protein